MSPLWEGPFFVIRRSRGGPYLLRDSTSEALIEKVPASQLKLISYEGAPSPDTYEVEKVVSHKGPPANRSYLVRWKGYSAEHDTWVKADDFVARECIDHYWDALRTNQGRPGASTRSSTKRKAVVPHPKATSTNTRRHRRS
jgi:hypothetical protein